MNYLLAGSILGNLIRTAIFFSSLFLILSWLAKSHDAALDIPIGANCFLVPSYMPVTVVGVEGEGKEDAVYTITPDTTFGDGPKLTGELQVKRDSLWKRPRHDLCEIEGNQYYYVGIENAGIFSSNAKLRKPDGSIIIIDYAVYCREAQR